METFDCIYYFEGFFYSQCKRKIFGSHKIDFQEMSFENLHFGLNFQDLTIVFQCLSESFQIKEL